MKKEIFVPTYQDKETGDIRYFCRLVNFYTPDEAKVVYVVNNSMYIETLLSIIEPFVLIATPWSELMEKMYGNLTVTVPVKDFLYWGFKIYDSNSDVEFKDLTEDDFLILGVEKKKS